MTAIADPSMRQIRVWTLPVEYAGDFAVFPWSATGWEDQPRLIPESCGSQSSGRGSATFTKLRAMRDEVYESDASSPDLVAGQYIAVTSGLRPAVPASPSGPAEAADAFDPAYVIWWGYIATITSIPTYTEQQDSIGTVTAHEGGVLLSTVNLSGWARISTGGVAEQPDGFEPGSANVEGHGGEIIGNHISGLFARASSQCGTAAANIWTRFTLLEHVIEYCRPANLPALTVNVPTDIEEWLDDNTIPEVFRLQNLTVGAFLDLIFPRARGLGWRLEWDWVITPYALLPDTGIGVPSQTPNNITLDPAEIRSLQFTDDDGAGYDEVVVRGAPIIFCGTVAAAKGWAAAQETAYLLGASAGAGYPTLTTDRIQRNSATRGIPDLDGVFTRYTIGDSATVPLYRNLDMTAPTGVNAFFPAVLWDGSALAFNDASYQDPQYQSVSISRQIPWPQGLKSDGTDNRSDLQKASPSYLPPRVLYYDSTLPTALQWQDLMAVTKKRGAPSVSPDDRSCGIVVKFGPPEWVAKGTWEASTPPGPVSPDPSSNTDAIDYRKMMFTVAIPSAQRVTVTARRAGLSADQVRRRLVIDRPDLELWVVHENTVIGVNAGGTADAVTARKLTRNDYPLAQRICDEAAAWALSERSAVSWEAHTPGETIAAASIGYMVGTVTDESSGFVKVVNGAIESVQYTFGNAPRVSVSVDLPAPLQGGSGMSRGGNGGAVSPTLQGTPFTALQQAQGDTRANKIGQAKTPIIPSHGGADPSGVTTQLLQIIGGNALASGVETIQYSATVTPAAVYDPDVDTVYPTGLGNAWLWTNGVLGSRVLVRNSFTGDQAAWFSGRFLRVLGTETLTYSGTDMTVYTAW